MSIGRRSSHATFIKVVDVGMSLYIACCIINIRLKQHKKSAGILLKCVLLENLLIARYVWKRLPF